MRLAVVCLAIQMASAGCFGGFASDRVEPADYLTATDYTKWVIEVDSSSGEAPSPALLDFLKRKLTPLVNKDVVEFRIGDNLPAGDADQMAWSDEEVSRFAASHKDVKTAGDTVSTHLLFLAGHYADDSGNSKVLGAAYGHDLIVIFSQSVKAACRSPIQPLPPLNCSPDPYFRAVTLHEFGHAIGLVNNGVDMVRPHEASTCNNQPDKGHHSTNEKSVMYCQVETSFIVQLSSPPTDFDDDDRADLRAAGGK